MQELKILCNQLEKKRILFIIIILLSIILQGIIMFVFFIGVQILFLIIVQKPSYEDRAKEIIFTHIKQVKYDSHSIKFISYKTNEDEMKNFCRKLWSFSKIIERKLEITIDNIPIVVAEVKLYRGSSRPQIIEFEGIIIKIPKKYNYHNLPFHKYKIYHFDDQTYIVVYKPKKLLELDLFREASKEYLTQKLKYFIHILSILI